MIQATGSPAISPSKNRVAEPLLTPSSMIEAPSYETSGW
jgi:hypothetical protein